MFRSKKVISVLLSAVLSVTTLITPAFAATGSEPVSYSPLRAEKVATSSAPATLQKVKNLSVDGTGDRLVWISGKSVYMYSHITKSTEVLHTDEEDIYDARISADGSTVAFYRVGGESPYSLIVLDVASKDSVVALRGATTPYLGFPTLTSTGDRIGSRRDSNILILTNTTGEKLRYNGYRSLGAGVWGYSNGLTFPNSDYVPQWLTFSADDSTGYVPIVTSSTASQPTVSTWNVVAGSKGTAVGGGTQNANSLIYGVSPDGGNVFGLTNTSTGLRFASFTFPAMTKTTRGLANEIPQAMSNNMEMLVSDTTHIEGIGNIPLDSTFAGFSKDSNILYYFENGNYYRVDLTEVMTNEVKRVPHSAVNFDAATDVRGVELSWDKELLATGAKIYRDGVLLTTITDGATVSYLDTTADKVEGHVYGIELVNAVGSSSLVEKSSVLGLKTPENFKIVERTAHSLAFSWDAVSNADYYEVSKNGNIVYTGRETNFLEEGLVSNTEYEYTVVAKTDTLSSDPATLKGTTDEVILAAPTDFVTTDVKSGHVSFSWVGVPQASGYAVFRDGREVYSGSSLIFTDYEVIPSKKYIYDVVSREGNSTSPKTTITVNTPSSEVIDNKPKITDPKAVNFRASEVTKTSALLLWNRILDADSYQISRNGVQVYNGTEPSFADIGLSSDSNYTYTLVGVNSYGVSSVITLQVRTKGDAPNKPTNLRATRVYDNQVGLAWDVVPNASLYKVYRDNTTLVYSGSLTAFLDTTVDRKQTYRYKVTAVNGSGETDSDILSVTTPDIPMQIVITATPVAETKEGVISFSFKLVVGVSEYHVERNPHWIFRSNGNGTFTETWRDTVTGEVQNRGIVYPSADGSLTVTDTKVIAGNKYHYNVTGVIKNQDGSETVTAKTAVIGTVPNSKSADGLGNSNGANNTTTGTVTGSTSGTKPTETTGTKPDLSFGNTKPTKSNKFTDISQHWGKSYIEDLASRGVITGYIDGTFLPNKEITRAEFTAIILRALGVQPSSTTSKFSDVANNAWYAGFVGLASDYGFVLGVGENNFAPERNITREEMSAIITRILSSIGENTSVSSAEATNLLSKFSDGNTVSSWSRNYMVYLVNAGLIQGADGKVSPKKFTTRAEVSAVISRLIAKY